MFDWLKGRKTYVIAATTFLLGGLSAVGVAVPAWLYALLAATGLGSLRAGVTKSADVDGK